ncbi:MAG: polysaccharide pyruvyl transferase CsaB [Butyricicoccus sp.]|nr:polysaccharide pyruvyl transferase CsaB [Butyricicoccus sp.]
MKIMHMMGGGDVGGAKTHIMTLIQALRANNEVRLISFRDGPFPQEAAQKGIDVRVIAGFNPLASAKAVIKQIEDFHPDVIHCHGAKANLVGAIVRRSVKIPVLTTVHSDYRYDYLGNPLKQYTFGTVNTVALRFLDYHQAVADRMARTLIGRGFDPERTFKIYNGMNFGDPVGEIDRKAYCKEQWGIDIADDDILCGIAARLTPIKDFHTCIRGFAGACREVPQLRLLIAGDGEDEPSLRALAAELGVSDRVTFCGWVSPVDKYFACLDINLLTSISETFPYSILEGVREGCATICSDVGGMSELIDSGENGYIFQPRDHETLTQQLLLLARDPQRRQDFAARLYDKAVREFSLDTMCRTQEENYRAIIRRFHAPKGRNGVVICGAYGRGNAGDDAILKAIVQEVRTVAPDAPITVLSRRPEETRLTYRTGAIHTFNLFAMCARMRKAKLYINGGGSLMQDVTSTRSLNYYLTTLVLGKLFGCKVMMYGCGIGPIDKPGNRKNAARVINRTVDKITLRDRISFDELGRLGVTEPEIILAADPTVTLAPASDLRIEQTMRDCGLDPNGRYLAFGLRTWKDFGGAADELARTAEYAYEQYGLTPLFVPIEHPKDLVPAKTVADKLSCPYAVIDRRLPIEVTIGILARMDAVLGIRLHALMFAATRGVPVVGVSYDVKIDGFLDYIGETRCVPLRGVTAEALCPLIDHAMQDAGARSAADVSAWLLDRETENSRGAAALLGL